MPQSKQPNKKSKRFLTNKEKIAIVEEAIRENNKKKVAQKYNIQPVQIRNWSKKINKLKEKQGKKTDHVGKAPKHEDIEDGVLKWFVHQRNAGHMINSYSVIHHAISLKPIFGELKLANQLAWCGRWMRRNNLTIRKKTHVAQHLPQNLTDSLLLFQSEVITTRKQYTYPIGLIGNMDQTPVYFESIGNYSIDFRGRKTINVITNGKEKQRITVALTVLADGKKLPPLIVYKGTPNGRIAKELTNWKANGYPAGVCYRVNNTAWFNEGMK